MPTNVKTLATLHFKDASGNTVDRSFECRHQNPSDSMVKKLVNFYNSKLTDLGFEGVTCTKSWNVAIDTTLPVAKTSIRDKARLQFRKSSGGVYTFIVSALKWNLRSENKVPHNAILDQWAEYFDDGNGWFDVQGDWFISDGEQLHATNGKKTAYLNGDIPKK